ncbi:hypothetical protein HYQ46_010138 [Verticillium longisporum]|nr:hypothetical protein HYQ46_010138 [Verticillium longisporum]
MLSLHADTARPNSDLVRPLDLWQVGWSGTCFRPTQISTTLRSDSVDLYPPRTKTLGRGFKYQANLTSLNQLAKAANLASYAGTRLPKWSLMDLPHESLWDDRIYPCRASINAAAAPYPKPKRFHPDVIAYR